MCMSHAKPEILLVRHGRPKVDWTPRLSVAQFRQWTKDYDDVGLSEESYPDDELRALINSSTHIFCSSLRRSQQTHQRAECDIQYVEEPIFNEIPLRVPNIPLIRMRPYRWARLAMNYHAFSGKKAATKRAELAAKLLINAAIEQNQKVALLGHGTMNGYILKALISVGWTCVRESAVPDVYWSWRQLNISTEPPYAVK